MYTAAMVAQLMETHHQSQAPSEPSSSIDGAADLYKALRGQHMSGMMAIADDNEKGKEECVPPYLQSNEQDKSDDGDKEECESGNAPNARHCIAVIDQLPDDTSKRSDFVYTDFNADDFSTLSNEEIRQRAIGRFERFSINWCFAVANLQIQLKENKDCRVNDDTTRKPTLQDILSQQDLNDVMSIESDPNDRAWSMKMLTNDGHSDTQQHKSPLHKDWKCKPICQKGGCKKKGKRR
jgi:hypothetical protein